MSQPSALPIRPARPGQAAWSPRTRDLALVPLAFVPLACTTLAFFADAHDSWTMMALASISFAAVFIGFVRAYLGLGRRNQMPLLVLYGALLFWFYYPCLAGALSDEQWHRAAALIRIENEDGLSALLGINVFTFMISLGSQLRLSVRAASRLRSWMGARPAPRSMRTFLFVVLGIVAGLSFYVIAAGGPIKAYQLMLASRTEHKPWDREGYQSSGIVVMDAMVEATLVALSALALHLALDSDQPLPRKAALTAIALATVAWIAIERGTRSILIEVALPPVGIYYGRVANRLSNARLWRTGVLLTIMFGLLLAANAQRQYRRTEQLEDVSFEVQNNDFFTETAFAFAVQKAENRLFHDSALLHIVSGPIPRFLWANKPVMDDMFVFTEYQWGIDTRDKGGNALPSVVGEYYMNWGWFGVFEVGLTLGLIFRLLDIVFGVSGGRDLARFGALGVAAYIFVSFRMLSFSFFPPMAVTVLIAAWLARSRFMGAQVPRPVTAARAGPVAV